MATKLHLNTREQAANRFRHAPTTQVADRPWASTSPSWQYPIAGKLACQEADGGASLTPQDVSKACQFPLASSLLPAMGTTWCVLLPCACPISHPSVRRLSSGDRAVFSRSYTHFRHAASGVVPRCVFPGSTSLKSRGRSRELVVFASELGTSEFFDRLTLGPDILGQPMDDLCLF